MDDSLTRREFLRRAAALGAAAAGVAGVAGLDGRALGAASKPTIAVASHKDPAGLVRAAVDALGGMGKFVKKGDVVLVKPNIGFAREPGQAATTTPEVVAEVVRLCRRAGAREIKVMDHSVDQPDSVVLRMSGIEEPARKAGARVQMASSAALYERLALPNGKAVTSVDVLRDLRRADVFINVPIAKVHSSTTLTLGLKNLLGVIYDRGALHSSSSMAQAIVDLGVHLKPQLTILDGIRILLSNGPKGPGRTDDPGLVIAGADIVAVDAYACSLFGLKPGEVEHIRLAGARRLGETDMKRVNVRKV